MIVYYHSVVFIGKDTKNREQNKTICMFFCRDEASSLIYPQIYKKKECRHTSMPAFLI